MHYQRGEIMDTGRQIDPPAAAGSSLVAPKSPSRRRLLRAGLGASPALLTIISEPVRADVLGSLPCRSASAFASIAAHGVTTSTQPAQTCFGIQPGGWAIRSVGSWPAGTFTGSGATAVSVTFSSVFSPGVTVGTNSSPTLLQVLESTDAGLEMARYFVAAYLNIKMVLFATPAKVETELQLKAMWPDAVNGTYTPITGGNPWDWATLKSWFLQTMPNSV
jgi:hypothetical protein